MNNHQMQLALLKICTYLKENEEVKEANKCHEWKEYVDKEIDRMEQILTKKLFQVDKVKNRVEGLCDDSQKINKIIEQQKDSSQKKNQQFIKRIENIENQFLNSKVKFNDQIQHLNIEIKNLQTTKVSNKDTFSKVFHAQRQFLLKQKCANSFDFDGKTVSKVKINNEWNQFVFNESVPLQNQFTFKIKIVKSKQNNILIGVVDYEKQKQQYCSHNSNNAVCYHANNGNKRPGFIKQGNGVNVGETVEVRVDRKNKIIKWIVNNEQRASFVHKMLGEQNRKLMPYVEIAHVGDTIEYSL